VTGHPLTEPVVLADVDALVAVIEGMRARSVRPGGRLLIGLVGAPGAGKSTVAAELAAALPATAVLPMDGFHLPQFRLVALGRRERMGAPDTFDVEGFVALLRALRDDRRWTEALRAPGFDREVEEPVPDAIELGPGAATVIIEGNYLLHDGVDWQRVAPLLDLTVALRLDDGVRHERLIARHVAHGKTLADARAWVLGPDEANARLIAPGLERADYSLSG